MIDYNKKYATITIRTTNKEKAQLERIANQERRTLGGLLYLWIMERLEEQPTRQAWGD